MAPDDDRPAFGWARYVQAAARLRLDVARNVDDFVFGREGRIVYVFDANVVQLFLDPAREVRNLSHFPDQQERQLVASAVVTSEFLFSRALPGQKGAAALLTSGHAEDLANMVDRVADGIRNLSRAGQLSDGGYVRLAERISHLLEKGDVRSIVDPHFVARMSDVLLEATADSASAAMVEGKQIARLLDEEALKPLSLHPAATMEVLRPPRSLIDFWDRSIARQRTLSRRKGAGDPRNRRDAVSIAQLIALNHSVVDAIVPTRVVLVTTDAALTRAYDDWFCEGDAPWSDYMLRRPQQYAPILNIEQINEGIDRTELVRYARDALDSLFDAASHGSEDAYLRSLIEVANSGRRRESRHPRPPYPLPGSPRARSILRELLDRWAKASRHATLLSLPAIEKRVSATLTPLLRIIRGQDVRRGIVDHLDALLMDLESMHTRLVLGDFAGRAGADGPRTPPGDEAPTLFRLEAVALRPGGTPSTPSSHPGDDGRIPPSQVESLVRAAIRAFQLRRWWVAERCAKRARVALTHRERRATTPTHHDGTERERFELLYMEVAAIRRAGLDDARFATAKVLLAEALRFHRACGDRFGEARTLGEAAALRLALVLGRQSQAKRWPPSQDPETLLALIEGADAAANSHAMLSSEDDRERELLTQVDVTLLGIEIYDRGVLRFGLVPEDVLGSALAFLHSEDCRAVAPINRAEIAYLQLGPERAADPVPTSHEASDDHEEESRAWLLEHVVRHGPRPTVPPRRDARRLF